MDKKVESLFKIIDNLSGYMDSDTAHRICGEINRVSGCLVLRTRKVCHSMSEHWKTLRVVLSLKTGENK